MVKGLLVMCEGRGVMKCLTGRPLPLAPAPSDEKGCHYGDETGAEGPKEVGRRQFQFLLENG